MKIIKLLISILLVTSGVLIGFCIKNFSLISWNKEIKIYEVFQVITTIFIATAIPFLIKKWIDDGRAIKSFLTTDANNLIVESEKIKEKFFKYYDNGKITADDKQYLMLLFTQMEDLIEHFGNALQKAFGMKCHREFCDVRTAHYVYWNEITGTEIMSDKWKIIDLDFLRFFLLEYNKFQYSIRIFLVEIQKI
jgi:hypothetical protein